jgi:hypothetical protein|tara:strand:+ start:5370 stop:5576 length:207 start_codon:yes stop_codon:yes gene_type:complete
MTSGKTDNVKKSLGLYILNLTVKIEIDSPITRLEITTAINKVEVLETRSNTFHELKKLLYEREKFMNL